MEILVADKVSENLAEQISQKTGLVCVPESEFILKVESGSLPYLLVKEETVQFVSQRSHFKPLAFDLHQLLKEKNSRIFRGRKDLLYRAAGFKNGCYSVVDATMGRGWDALSLWQLGTSLSDEFQLHGVERNPVVYSLLFGAVYQLAKNGYRTDSLRLYCHEGERFLNDMSKRPDLVYLDPMFHEKSKKALPRKEIQILRELVGEDFDQKNLLLAALKVAQKRVVVKRPIKAPPLLSGVSHSFEGKQIRYDVYI